MIPRTWASETKIKERGVDRTSLVVANGTKIEQYGTKKIVGECMNGMKIEVEVKVADVQRGLLSASRLQEEAGIDTMLTSMPHMISEGQNKREELEKKRGDHLLKMWQCSNEEEETKVPKKRLTRIRRDMIEPETVQVRTEEMNEEGIKPKCPKIINHPLRRK